MGERCAIDEGADQSADGVDGEHIRLWLEVFRCISTPFGPGLAKQRAAPKSAPIIKAAAAPATIARMDTPQSVAASRSGDRQAIALTISSHIFFASPNSIIVLSRKNSSLSTPAYPEDMPRLTNRTVPDFSTSRIGMP